MVDTAEAGWVRTAGDPVAARPLDGRRQAWQAAVLPVSGDAVADGVVDAYGETRDLSVVGGQVNGGQAAERRRLDEIEAARQKRIRRETAMEEARVQYAEAYRARHLEAQEAAWRRTTRLTEYVSAAHTRVEAMPPGQARTDAEAWISWATATVGRLDPLSSPPLHLVSRNVTTEMRMGQGQPTARRPIPQPLQGARRHTVEGAGRQPLTTHDEPSDNTLSVRQTCVTCVEHASNMRQDTAPKNS